MDNNQKNKSRTSKFWQWFKRKDKRRTDNFFIAEVTDWGEEEEEEEREDYLDDISVESIENDSCVSTNELRVFVGTWNVAGRSPVGSLAVDVDEWLNLKDAADIYVLGFQEIVPLKARNVIRGEDPTEATKWNLLIGRTLNDKHGCPMASDNCQYGGAGEGYKLMACKKMVGVFISVWMKRELVRRYCVSSVRVCSVACGIMGYLGNKGSVSVSMLIEGTSFCFVCAHLASGEKRGDEARRNRQVSQIFRRTCFSTLRPQDAHNTNPLTILGHDGIFWFGDLNYRLYLDDKLARQLIKKQDWRGLQEFDELERELQDGGVFQGWKEGDIEFAPTYKYSSSNCYRYSGGAGFPGTAGEKQRTPAWYYTNYSNNHV
ncbi:phosphoinositide 5-phosphatase [Sarracenia purpurea var. burkii]